jgi:hypothetical protein
MKLSHQLSLCFVVLFLLTAFIVMDHNLAQAEEKPVAERLVTINLEDKDFTQTLKTIADQAGITINIHGQTPAGKRDISITNMSLNEAMGHILRIYAVRNHAAAYNPDTGAVMLAILETSTMLAALSPQTQTRIDAWISKPLTKDQEELLRTQSEIIVAEMEELSLPLVPYQLEQLREKSAELDSEMHQQSQPLTPEQLEHLSEQSRLIELEMEEISQPLTEEQLQRLKAHSDKIEEEMEIYSQPLTEEQMQSLRETSQELEEML